MIIKFEYCNILNSQCKRNDPFCCYWIYKHSMIHNIHLMIFSFMQAYIFWWGLWRRYVFRNRGSQGTDLQWRGKREGRNDQLPAHQRSVCRQVYPTMWITLSADSYWFLSTVSTSPITTSWSFPAELGNSFRTLPKRQESLIAKWSEQVNAVLF